MTHEEPKAKKEKEAWELARPHKFMFTAEANALVCLFRLNPTEAKKYCADLDVIDKNTGADEMLLSMFFSRFSGDVSESTGSASRLAPTVCARGNCSSAEELGREPSPIAPESKP